MAKSKSKSKKAVKEQVTSLQMDLETIKVPFDLFTGLSLVTEELKTKGFTYSHLTEDRSPILTFNSEELSERVSVNIEKENLLVRQFSIDDKGDRKLKVIYVVKPSERKFNLI